MTDYFALLGEARRAWLDPEKLKEKYFALNRATAADAELNEAFRVLSDPKLRLHHLLTLDGAELTASRQVPPSVAELFWNTGTLLREVEQWLLRSAEATSTLVPRLAESGADEARREVGKAGGAAERAYETELAQLRQIDAEVEIGFP